MRHQVPSGDLATLIEIAVTEKLECVERARLGPVGLRRSHGTTTNATNAMPPIQTIAARMWSQTEMM